ncbi:MAG: extracellular solute-binding protein, partial [candidate division Zixibacteria bacterium]|nr:extracellular solute-binding protein [candidate division Zixibacteria bacterium]
MKNYKTLTGIILISLCGIFLFSCGGGSNQVTLQWWHFWTDPVIKPVIDKMIADYENANPGIKIEQTGLTWGNGHEKIVIAFSSGTAPDIVELGSDWVAEFSYSDNLSSLTEVVVKDSNQFLGWTPGIYNNNIYAFPWILGTRVLFINRDLATQAGYNEQYFPTNWQDLKKTCSDIHKLSDNIFGFGSNAAEKHRLYKKVLP